MGSNGGGARATPILMRFILPRILDTGASPSRFSCRRSSRRVEGDCTVALPPDDTDYQTLANTEPGLGGFLSRFSTSFGQPLRPTIIARNQAAPLISAEELSAFRNLIALAAITQGRLERHRSQQSSGAFFTEIFDFSPVELGQNGTSVVINSPFSRGMHELTSFAGQPAPIIPYPQNTRCSTTICSGHYYGFGIVAALGEPHGAGQSSVA